MAPSGTSLLLWTRLLPAASDSVIEISRQGHRQSYSLVFSTASCRSNFETYFHAFSVPKNVCALM